MRKTGGRIGDITPERFSITKSVPRLYYPCTRFDPETDILVSMQSAAGLGLCQRNIGLKEGQKNPWYH